MSHLLVLSARLSFYPRSLSTDIHCLSPFGASTITRYLVAPPVDARNVNGHVNHVAAQLVGCHVHRVEVGRYVNPRDYIKQERFLHHAVLFRIDRVG